MLLIDAAIFGFKLKFANLICADQMNADLPTFNLMGAKMSRTNVHKDEPDIVELRARTGRADQSDAQHKCPIYRGAFHQLQMIRQRSLSWRKSVCVRNVIHRANDVVQNHSMSSLVGCAVSDK